MNVAFVGHFAPLLDAYGKASSIAGNLVQRKILEELMLNMGEKNVYCYVMAPMPSWPNGPLAVQSFDENKLQFIGYVNLPVLKHIIFSLRLLQRLLCGKWDLCIQYNSYLFENFVVLLSKILCRTRSIGIIIQDVHVLPKLSLLTKRGLRSISERLSINLAKHFDTIVPISSAIVGDFALPADRCFIFSGGITDLTEKILLEPARQLDEVAIFAGGLEPHNGIDRLVDVWLASKIEYPLHIFGRGSLQGHVELAARKSNRIVYHGFQTEQVVMAWIARARWNFCLRYSRGLIQEYFFPSKFFNILCASGTVMVNDFHSLPDNLRNYICILPDDLSGLADRLSISAHESNPNIVKVRREIVLSEYSWRSCIRRILNINGLTQ